MCDAPSGEALIRCQDLVVGYGGQAMLPACNLEIRRGQFLVILGRNGSGKTTFFRTVLGLIPAVSGRATRASSTVRLAYVGQGLSIDPAAPLRVRDIVGWGQLSGWSFLRPRRVDAAARDTALADAGAMDFADAPFNTLSEGQKQKVLLARMLVSRPDVAFLDEPTAAMDEVAEGETMSTLGRLARERQMAVVVITHQIALAARLADEIVFLDRDHQLVVSGNTRQVLAHPVFRGQFDIHREGLS